MVEYIIPAAAAVVVAAIEAVAAVERRAEKEHRAKSESAAELRAEESRLQLQMIEATLQLSIVEANALTGGHNNGNVERARNAAEQAETAYNEFCQRIAKQKVSE